MRAAFRRFLKIFAFLAAAFVVFLIFVSLFTAYAVLHPARVTDGKTPSSPGYSNDKRMVQICNFRSLWFLFFVPYQN